MIGLFFICAKFLHRFMQDIALKYAKHCTFENRGFAIYIKGIWHFFDFVPLFLYSSSNIRLEPLKRFRVNE